MCHYQTLYHNDKTGYAIRCSQCEKIQVAYGNLVMTFSSTDFEAFHRWISKVKNEQQPHENPQVRCLMVPAPCHGFQLLLSYNELEELAELFEQADTEWQSIQLIGLFNS